MITEEERKAIIDDAVEKALLMIPEVVGNLMTNHVMLTKTNEKFYSEYPEFKDHRELVASVVEMIDGNNQIDDYEKLLSMAVPEIRKRINMISELNMIDVTPKPNRDFSSVNGEL